jgi:integrase
MKTPAQWPKVIRSGSATIKIYLAKNSKGSRTYQEYKVVYYDRPDHRLVKTFSEYEAAHTYAANALASLTRGDVQALTLSSDDRLVYLRAQQAIAGLGIPLDIAVSDYAAVRKMLGTHSLRDAVEFYLNSCRNLVSRTVREVVDELIQSKRTPSNKARPASKYYLQDLESRLGKFADSFQCPIIDVNNSEIRLFLGSIQGSGRTWYNYARLLKTLFRFAQANRYYPKSIDPFEGIGVAYDDDAEVEIFTPAELRRLLGAAKPDVLPFLVIGAFAGLRHAELCRLDWADIKHKYIEIKKGNAKTRSRRLIPIQPNLARWIAVLRKDAGPVVPYVNMGNQLVKMIAKGNRAERNRGAKKLCWKHNGLRHSFVSYRMAIVQNENQVAMEAGNSPGMIHQHYRELVTPAEARHWFSIVPGPAENVAEVTNAEKLVERSPTALVKGSRSGQ